MCDSVKGLYLQENLHRHTRSHPLVYANFVSSLDGRIAVAHKHRSQIPESLVNDNDLRLFFELLAQADCVITHGAYFRARAAGRLGNIFSLDDDLMRWRKRHRFPSLKVVVCSASLDFPTPRDLPPQQLLIATGENHDSDRAGYWRRQGYQLVVSGNDQWVEADLLLEKLREYPLRSIYLAAGPKLFESALEKQRVDLLYLTLSHQLTGGRTFHTLIPGASIDHCHLRQERLLFDDSEEQQHPQWFAKFECRYSCGGSQD